MTSLNISLPLTAITSQRLPHGHKHMGPQKRSWLNLATRSVHVGAPLLPVQYTHTALPGGKGRLRVETGGQKRIG